MAENADITKTERKRRDFEETSRFASEASQQWLQAARDKTARLRQLRLAKERGKANEAPDWNAPAEHGPVPRDH